MNFKIRKLVKNKIKMTLRLALAIIIPALTFTACSEQSDLGIEILPGEDLINVKSLTIKDDITSYTALEESLISSGGVSLLGSFNDPDFGSTNIDFATQFRMLYYPDWNGSEDGSGFGTNPVVDSLIFYIYYQGVYGDTITPQNIKVYELISDLDVDEEYTQDIDLESMASDELLGEIEFTPKIKIDTTRQDTLYELIKIHLDPSLGEKLLNLDSTMMASNDTFLEAFKGLYLDCEEIPDAIGGLLTLRTVSTNSLLLSHLRLYYNNEENMAVTEEPDTMFQHYVVTENSARVNSIVHNYTSAPFNRTVNDKLYVQPTGGLKGHFYIDGWESWQDSANIGINKAELVFRVDTIASDIHNYAPPAQLVVTFIDDNGDEKLPGDFYYNPRYFGGALNSNYEYRFNITQHMELMMADSVGNNGFYISTGRRTFYPNRVILEGGHEEGKGIELNITYSTFLQ